MLRGGLGELAGDVRHQVFGGAATAICAWRVELLLLERSPDGEGYAWVLEVDEEGLAVG